MLTNFNTPWKTHLQWKSLWLPTLWTSTTQPDTRPRCRIGPRPQICSWRGSRPNCRSRPSERSECVRSTVRRIHSERCLQNKQKIRWKRKSWPHGPQLVHPLRTNWLHAFLFLSQFECKWCLEQNVLFYNKFGVSNIKWVSFLRKAGYDIKLWLIICQKILLKSSKTGREINSHSKLWYGRNKISKNLPDRQAIDYYAQ